MSLVRCRDSRVGVSGYSVESEICKVSLLVVLCGVFHFDRVLHAPLFFKLRPIVVV